MKCLECGAEVENGIPECPSCHTKIQANIKLCPECGVENSSLAAFCKECGHRFETNSNEETIQLTEFEERKRREKEITEPLLEKEKEITHPLLGKDKDQKEKPKKDIKDISNPTPAPDGVATSKGMFNSTFLIAILMGALLLIGVVGFFVFNSYINKTTTKALTDISSSKSSNSENESSTVTKDSQTDSSNTSSSSSSNASSSSTNSNSSSSKNSINPGIHTYQYMSGNVTYDQAVEKARQAGGYLVHIDSQEEFNKIVSDVSKLHDQGSEVIEYYIGGKRDSDSNEYYWVDEYGEQYGSPINAAFGNWFWYQNEPSYYDPNNPEYDEDVLTIIYIKRLDRWFGNDTLQNIVGALPEFSGKVGYIIEIE